MCSGETHVLKSWRFYVEGLQKNKSVNTDLQLMWGGAYRAVSQTIVQSRNKWQGWGAWLLRPLFTVLLMETDVETRGGMVNLRGQGKVQVSVTNCIDVQTVITSP